MRYLIVLAAAMALSGCAGWVVFGHKIGEQPSPAGVPPAPAAEASAPQTVTRAVSAVEVSVSPAAQAKTSAHFSSDALRAAMEDELRSRGLLSVSADASDARKIELLVENFDVHRMTNAVVMGQVISSGKLTTHVTVRDAAGRELQGYQTVADTKLSHAADANKGDDLSPLYRHLATLAVNGLDGAPPKPAPASTANTDVPR